VDNLIALSATAKSSPVEKEPFAAIPQAAKSL
jgi:hypothetical protein